MSKWVVVTKTYLVPYAMVVDELAHETKSTDDPHKDDVFQRAIDWVETRDDIACEATDARQSIW